MKKEGNKVMKLIEQRDDLIRKKADFETNIAYIEREKDEIEEQIRNLTK